MIKEVQSVKKVVYFCKVSKGQSFSYATKLVVENKIKMKQLWALNVLYSFLNLQRFVAEGQTIHPNSTELIQFLTAFFEPFGLSEINILTNASNPIEFRTSITMINLEKKLKFIKLKKNSSDVEFVPKNETFLPTSKLGVVVLSNTGLTGDTLKFVSDSCCF